MSFKPLFAATLIAIVLPATLQAQSLGDIRGAISPDDARSARFLNAYPQTEQQQFFDYQPVRETHYAAATPSRGYTSPDNSSVTVYSPNLGPSRKPGLSSLGPIDQPPQPYHGRAALLGTHAGVEVGLNFSNYHYQEPSVGSPPVRVTLDGFRYGAHLAGTLTFADGMQITPLNTWFITAETLFSYASVDYEGSGTSKEKDDYLSESRLTGGRDFLLGGVGLSPYAGIGYRYLFNDLRGLTSTGASGYRRQSQYLYVPLGATARFDLFGDGSRISLNGEYDLFLRGWQTSFISDIALGSDLTNTQDHGHGFRASLMYENGPWSFGPFFNYWNIGKSDTVCNATPVCGFEPYNQTLEYGLKASYRFWNF